MVASPLSSDETIAGRHRVVVIGGGSAGISVAARLRRAGVRDVTLVEPSDSHWYQPLWTLVGGGQATLRSTRRAEAAVIPDGVRWIRRHALAVDPDARTVTLSGGAELAYEYLVMAPGLQLDWDAWRRGWAPDGSVRVAVRFGRVPASVVACLKIGRAHV